MDANIDDLFRLCQIYEPQSVGVEISGQQKGFIPWIQDQMLVRNIFFNLAAEKGSKQSGLRPNTNKMQRFNVIVPLFKLKKIWFPEELRYDAIMVECMDELRKAAIKKFKSKHDDFLDTISMLGVMTAWKPSQVTPEPGKDDHIWDEWAPKEEAAALDGYLV